MSKDEFFAEKREHEARIERYYYAPHRSQWGVWKRMPGPDSTFFGQFVKDFPTKEEARSYVYEMNGWKLKNRHGSSKQRVF